MILILGVVYPKSGFFSEFLSMLAFYWTSRTYFSFVRNFPGFCKKFIELDFQRVWSSVGSRMDFSMDFFNWTFQRIFVDVGRTLSFSPTSIFVVFETLLVLGSFTCVWGTASGKLDDFHLLGILYVYFSANSFWYSPFTGHPLVISVVSTTSLVLAIESFTRSLTRSFFSSRSIVISTICALVLHVT